MNDYEERKVLRRIQFLVLESVATTVEADVAIPESLLTDPAGLAAYVGEREGDWLDELDPATQAVNSREVSHVIVLDGSAAQEVRLTTAPPSVQAPQDERKSA